VAATSHEEIETLLVRLVAFVRWKTNGLHEVDWRSNQILPFRFGPP
jgi:hypothetical protein